MSKTTRATQTLAKAGVTFSVHTYDYDPDAERIGLQAAEALGEEPCRVLKTLMAELDGKPVCVVLPSDKEVSMKKLAAAFGGKSAAMMKPADAERLTGYHVGGISPFGQKKYRADSHRDCRSFRAAGLYQRWPARAAGEACAAGCAEDPERHRRRDHRLRARAAAPQATRLRSLVSTSASASLNLAPRCSSIERR